METFMNKDQIPVGYKTKEDLQKIGKIPTGSPIAKLNERNRICYLFDLKESAPIPSRKTIYLQPTINNLAKALFVVNRHAKTSPEPYKLYQLKTKVIEKLITEGKAEKVGLQQSPNPSKFHQQTSNTLVKVAEYGFHIISSREDLLELPHLGEWSEDFRNPTESLPLRQAVQLLEKYCHPSKNKPSSRRPVSPQRERKSVPDPFARRRSR